MVFGKRNLEQPHIFNNRAPVRIILEISSSKSTKMTRPCGAFATFGSFVNDHVEGFYINSISNCSARARLLRPRFEENRAPVRRILIILSKMFFFISAGDGILILSHLGSGKTTHVLFSGPLILANYTYIDMYIYNLCEYVCVCRFLIIYSKKFRLPGFGV